MPAIKPTPRLVPTLTEVVRPGVTQPAAALDRDRLVEQVLEAVKPRLEQQLRRALSALIDEQIRNAAPQWRRDIEASVDAALEQARRPKGKA